MSIHSFWHCKIPNFVSQKLRNKWNHDFEVCTKAYKIGRREILFHTLFFPQVILPYELPLFKMIHFWVYDSTAARGRADGPSSHLRPCGCPWSVLLHEACWCEWPVMTLRAMTGSMAGCHGDACGLYCHQRSCWGPCLCWQRRPCEYRAPCSW